MSNGIFSEFLLQHLKVKWEIFPISNPSVLSACLKGFEDDSVVMRFGKMELVRNQWRKFQFEIDTQVNM